MRIVELDRLSGTPAFRQIVDQIRFAIDGGSIADGDRIPAHRALAESLGLSRNTVVRAYAELTRLGYLVSRGSGGMIARKPQTEPIDADRRIAASTALSDAIQQCLDLGLAPQDIARIARQECLHAQSEVVRVSFVERDNDRAALLASELSDRVRTPISPLGLAELRVPNVRTTDVVVTTSTSRAEVRRMVESMHLLGAPEVVAIPVTAHASTLEQLSRVPRRLRVGILASDPKEARHIWNVLTGLGLPHLVTLSGTADADLKECELVVVPDTEAALARRLERRVKVLSFGQTLDPAWSQLVADIVAEIQQRKDLARRSGVLGQALAMSAP